MKALAQENPPSGKNHPPTKRTKSFSFKSVLADEETAFPGLAPVNPNQTQASSSYHFNENFHGEVYFDSLEKLSLPIHSKQNDKSTETVKFFMVNQGTNTFHGPSALFKGNSLAGRWEDKAQNSNEGEFVLLKAFKVLE